eukprot:COSAG04_NODE_473_length_13807_cov_13.893499_8_plen_117_part_00
MAFAHRGGCPFAEKVERVAAAGAVALLVVNTEDGLMEPGGVEESPIPVLMVRKSAGEALASTAEAALSLEGGDGRVTITFSRQQSEPEPEPTPVRTPPCPSQPSRARSDPPAFSLC